MIGFQDLKISNAPFMEDLAAAAGRVIRSGRYINGPEVAEFERELADIVGVRHCVAVSTGLDALRLILRAYIHLGRLQPGDEVVVPANTFIATFLAVTDCGLTAVAADVDPSTFCLDFSRLPVSGKTKAVIAVHLYGHPCLDETTVSSLHERSLLVIEDAAQAIGASADGLMAGAIADAAAFSFYPAKNIGALGDAGAVTTDDEALVYTVRKLANYGSMVKYSHELCGLNCRMDELQAALLMVKLPHTAEITDARNRRAALYSRLIVNPDVTLPSFPREGMVSAWHQYVICHPRRDDLRRYLASHGVGTEIHYPVPCHRQPCYAPSHLLLKTAPEGLPMAESLASRILSLPIADVSPEDINVIANLINDFKACLQEI